MVTLPGKQVRPWCAPHPSTGGWLRTGWTPGCTGTLVPWTHPANRWSHDILVVYKEHLIQLAQLSCGLKQMIVISMPRTEPWIVLKPDWVYWIGPDWVYWIGTLRAIRGVSIVHHKVVAFYDCTSPPHAFIAPWSRTHLALHPVRLGGVLVGGLDPGVHRAEHGPVQPRLHPARLHVGRVLVWAI